MTFAGRLYSFCLSPFKALLKAVQTTTPSTGRLGTIAVLAILLLASTPPGGVYNNTSGEARFNTAGLEPGEPVIAVQIPDALNNLDVRQAVAKIT